MIEKGWRCPALVRRVGVSRSIRLFGWIAAVGTFPFGAGSSSPERHGEAPPVLAPRAAIHATHSRSLDLMELPQQDGTAAHSERAFLPAPQTRTSFMATWATVAGATGYRLDVSSSPRFETYVDGYRDLDVGNVPGRVVTQLKQGTTYYYRVRAYNASAAGSSVDVASATTTASSGLIINATFDGSITSNPNAAAIEAAINRAIAIFESLFSDRLTIPILFRYSTKGGTVARWQEFRRASSPFIPSPGTHISMPWQPTPGAVTTSLRRRVCPRAHCRPTWSYRARTGEQSAWIRRRASLPTEVSVPARPMMESSPSTPLTPFCSTALRGAAFSMRRPGLSTRSMKSWPSAHLRPAVAICSRKICSAGRRRELETIHRAAHAIYQSMEARPGSFP